MQKFRLCKIHVLNVRGRYYAPRNAVYGHQQLLDAIIKDGLWDVYNQIQ